MPTAGSSVGVLVRLTCSASAIDSQETRLLASGVPSVSVSNRNVKRPTDGGPRWWWHGFICDGEARLSV